MKKRTEIDQPRHHANRRRFLVQGCAACAGAGLLAATGRIRAKDKSKQHLRVVFALADVVETKPDWPHVGFDFKPVMEKYRH